MENSPVQKDGKTYKYILTVQDIFSRYVWLRPLQGKSSHGVANKLAKLYYEVGPPNIIQSDNGGEFKKAVEKLCKILHVKIIRGSPYHPQSQGKVERSHRSLRKKIMFDLLRLAKDGVNWVASLREYQKLLNEDCKDVLGKQSSFEVFYGRDSNAVTNFVHKGQVSKEKSCRASTGLPKRSDLKTRSEKVKQIRKKAKSSSDVWDQRYIKRRLKNNPPSTYGVGETVLLRFPTNRHGPNRHCTKEKIRCRCKNHQEKA